MYIVLCCVYTVGRVNQSMPYCLLSLSFSLILLLTVSPPFPPQEPQAGILFDRVISDSENEHVILRRKEEMNFHQAAGVEVTGPCYSRHSQGDTSTPHSSYYFGSRDSITGSEFRFGGHIPRGYTSTDESSTKVNRSSD